MRIWVEHEGTSITTDSGIVAMKTKKGILVTMNIDEEFRGQIYIDYIGSILKNVMDDDGLNKEEKEEMMNLLTEIVLEDEDD